MRLSGSEGLRGFAVMLFLSLICSVAAVSVYHAWFSQGAVVADIAGFIAHQRNEYAAGRISAAELVENINGLVSEINSGEKNRVYIIDRTAGIAGRKDPVPGPAAEDDEYRE